MDHVLKDVIPFSIRDTYMDESTKGDANLKCVEDSDVDET
jgi:hypothetical protein